MNTSTKGQKGVWVWPAIPNPNQASAVVKSITRHLRKTREFRGPWDYATWCVLHPQMATEFSKAAQLLVGRPGRFLPRL